MTERMLVEIVMDGGIIQSIKAPKGCTIVVRDYDTEGTTEDVQRDADGAAFIEFGWEGNGEWQ